MKNMARKASLFLIGIIMLSGSIFAADFYVDIKSETAEKNGTAETPFTTLRQAVDAANLLVGEASTIYVRGGEDRVYAIEGANDLVSVTVSNLTIQAWGDFGKPTIALHENLSASVANPKVIYIQDDADFCVVKNLNFTYFNTASSNASNVNGKSLGQSGAIIEVGGNDVVVDGCSFIQTGNGGKSDWGSNNGCILSQASEGDWKNNIYRGLNLVVKNCYFKHNYQQGYGAVRLGGGGRIIGCTFDDCAQYFITAKSYSDMSFISNRVINSTAAFITHKEGYNSMENAVVAFNIFVGDNTAFIDKGKYGMDGAPKIYNNTFVGKSSFLRTFSNEGTVPISWAPQIFNNLIVCTDANSVVLREDQKSLSSGQTTAYKDASFFKNNAYYASSFNGGSTQNIEGYEFHIAQENNIVLDGVPEFLSLDPESPDFCRVKLSKNPTFAGKGLSWRDDGKYPDYIGAVEPNRAQGFFIIFR